MSAWNIKFCYTDYQHGRNGQIAVIHNPKSEDAVGIDSEYSSVLTITVKNKENHVKSIAMMDPSSYGYADGCAAGWHDVNDNHFDCYKDQSEDYLSSGRTGTLFYRLLARALNKVEADDTISICYISRYCRLSPRFFQYVNLDIKHNKEIKGYFIDFIPKYYPECKGGFYDVQVSEGYFALTGKGNFVNMDQFAGNELSKKWQLGEEKFSRKIGLTPEMSEGKMRWEMQALCEKPLPCDDPFSFDDENLAELVDPIKYDRRLSS